MTCAFCILNYTDLPVSTVLIAAPEHLQTLKEREDFSGAQTFSDAEALRALEVITRKRPDVVALERVFAATTRGAALINRIKADPKLSSCEIRIVAHDSGYSRVPAGAPAAAPTAPPSRSRRRRAGVTHRSIQRGTRRAPRFKIVDGVEVMIDGNAGDARRPVGCRRAGHLCRPSSSPTSASACRLPRARSRSASAPASRGPRSSLRKTGPRYRAGIEFFDAEADAVQKFCDAKRNSRVGPTQAV